MIHGNAINFKSKSMEVERLISNLQLLGLHVSDYYKQFKDICSNCQKEIDEEKAKEKNTFTASYIDAIYSKYFKMLRDLNHSLDTYRKLFRAYETSQVYKRAEEDGVLVEENIAIYVNDAIREIGKLVSICDFSDENCNIFLKKILPSYLIVVEKELLFHGQSILLSFIENAGLSEIFRSVLNVDLDDAKLNPSSLEVVLESDANFTRDVSLKLQEQYDKIMALNVKNEEINSKISEKNRQYSETENKKKNAHVARLLASLTALTVLVSSLIYGANKGLKSASSNKLYQTTKESYSTVDGIVRTSSNYEEKISSGEKTLVVSYMPWEEYMENNYSRDVITADVSDIDYNALEEYVNLNLANLSNVSVEVERKSNLSEDELYSKQITEVIRLVQDSNNYIVDGDNFVYKYSLAIVLFAALLGYATVKFSLLFAGITEGVIDTTVREIIKNLKLRKDSKRILQELDIDISNLIKEYNTNNKNIDALMKKFRVVYEKYRFLIKDSETLEKYDTLVRRREN